MQFKDFRDYLDNLERQGMLLRVKKEVSPRFEIAAGVYKTGISDPKIRQYQEGTVPLSSTGY